MNPWTLIYVVAGAWSIFLIVWSIARDALELRRWGRERGWRPGEWDGPPEILGSRAYAIATAVVVGLWIAAALLR